MLEIVAKLLGIIGLLVVTRGIFVRARRTQCLIFALGGCFLILYSAYLRDTVFILLQLVFIVSSVYEWRVLARRPPSSPS